MKTSLVIGIIMVVIVSFGFKKDDTGMNVRAATGTLVTDWVSVPAGAYTYGPGDTAKTIAYNYSVMKYEVTNAQYLQYLQEALAAGEITISGSSVEGQYPWDAQWAAGTKGFYALGSNTSSDKYGQINYSGGNFQLTPDNSCLPG
jgi:formylglycine-generating enzyme required for sulfatase activity